MISDKQEMCENFDCIVGLWEDDSDVDLIVGHSHDWLLMSQISASVNICPTWGQAYAKHGDPGW